MNARTCEIPEAFRSVVDPIDVDPFDFSDDPAIASAMNDDPFGETPDPGEETEGAPQAAQALRARAARTDRSRRQRSIQRPILAQTGNRLRRGPERERRRRILFLPRSHPPQPRL